MENNSISKHWHIMHVKPRCEKKARAWFSSFHFLHILPVCTQTKTVQRRKVVTETPVFTGYIFARMPPERQLDVARSKAIVHSIPVQDARIFVHQLHQIVKAAKTTNIMTTVPQCEQGKVVSATRGPLKGVEGILKETDGKAVLVLNVKMLGWAIEIAVNASDF